MKQSSIEFIVDNLLLPEHGENPKWVKDIIDQAKQMQKQEIIDSFMAGAEIGEMHNNENRKFYIDAKQYYKHTYEK